MVHQPKLSFFFFAIYAATPHYDIDFLRHLLQRTPCPHSVIKNTELIKHPRFLRYAAHSMKDTRRPCYRDAQYLCLWCFLQFGFLGGCLPVEGAPSSVSFAKSVNNFTGKLQFSRFKSTGLRDCCPHCVSSMQKCFSMTASHVTALWR